MKILFEMDAVGYSGACKMMVWLANRLAIEGHDITILTAYRKPENQAIHSLIHKEHLGAPLYSSWILRNTTGLVNITKKLWQYLRSDRFDLFISFGGDNPALILLLICRLLKLKTRIIFSERMDPLTNNGLLRMLGRRLFRLADLVVFQSPQAMAVSLPSLQAKGVVIPNPVIAADIPPKWEGQREQIIVTAGRLDCEQKRQDILILAFAKIASNFPDIKLSIFGSGESENDLKRLVKECDLQTRVIFHGATSKIYQSIKKARLFVFTSDYEGVPNALIEAMSVGLPVISTDCSPGGARYLIESGVNGIIVPRGDVDALAFAMKQLLNNSQDAERIGLEALKIKERFAEDAIFHSWLSYL